LGVSLGFLHVLTTDSFTSLDISQSVPPAAVSQPIQLLINRSSVNLNDQSLDNIGMSIRREFMAISIGENVFLFALPSSSFLNSTVFLVLTHPLTMAIVGIFCVVKLYQQWKSRPYKRTNFRTNRNRIQPNNYKIPQPELELKDD